MRKNAVIICIFLAGILFLRFFLVPFKDRLYRQEPFMLRVRLVQEKDKLELSAGSICTIKEAGTEKVLLKKINIGKNARITPYGGEIKLNEEKFRVAGIEIIPRKKDSLSLEGIDYRGSIKIFNNGGKLDAINIVELEDYLKGVLPREMNRFWPFSAMKAQAIASRSFAVNKALKREDQEYDLRADAFSQVYGGKSSERWRTSRVVTATKGKVLVYDEKIVPAYFHSCCGGYTRKVSDAWEGNEKPLKRVKCSWCGLSPHFRWRMKISTKDIIEKLDKKGYSIESIDNIVAGPRDPSNRLKYLRIKAGDKWFEIKVNEFRSIMGNSVMKSSNFHVKRYLRFYIFSGYGWGHGVGMCQWGAFGLALKGKSEDKILNIYYPGAKIRVLNTVIK
ncbi:MAG: SpoIID/LytB domain-containing protein [Candidatus Omnitrophota bacterium]